MVCIDRRTRAKSSMPSTPESLRARSRREPPPPPPSRLSLGDSSWRSTATLLRTAAALVGVCIVLIGAEPIPLKRPGAELLSGTIQSIDMSPKELALPVRRLLPLRCRVIPPDSGGDPAIALIALEGSGSSSGLDLGSSSGFVGGQAKVSRAGWTVGVGVGERETSGGRGGTAGGRDERREEPMRERSRTQTPSLSGETDKSPDGSPVNRGGGALWAEKGIGSTPT